jgi:endonuclease/exonuclease/phosphatase family metal-dependent hydrolase
MPFTRLEPLVHELGAWYPRLRAIRDRRALERSALWAELGAEVERVLQGVERGDHRAVVAREHVTHATRAGASEHVRAVAWNIHRGARLEQLAEVLAREQTLAEADVLLLSEVDLGLGRSGNRNVARELADRLGMSYAFGTSYLTLEDDLRENPARIENTIALAGTAILSRRPITAAVNVALPELRDKFSSSERRLGRKRALMVELALANGPLRVAACHLDSNASPAQRAQQLDALLGALGSPDDDVPALVGGDLNTSTYDLSAPLASVRDFLHKLFVRGLARSFDEMMTPERGAERPVFATLERHGFAIDDLNDRATPTYQFDFDEPYTLEKTRRDAGRLVLWLVRRMLRGRAYKLPSRLDWFAGRGVRPLGAHVVAAPRATDGSPLTDHAAIACEFAVGAPLAAGAR